MPGTAFGGPPDPGEVGFALCHEQLAKDHPDSGRGAEISPTGSTYHDVARQTAIAATRDSWEALHDRIVATYGGGVTDAECLFMKLAWGGDRTCHRAWLVTGTLRNRIGDVGEGSAEGYEAHLRWTPTRYPGPNAAPVFAPLEGQWTHSGTTRVRLADTSSGVCNWAAAFDNQGAIEGRLKVVPQPQDPEFFSLWADAAAPTANLTCTAPGGSTSVPGGPLGNLVSAPFVLFFTPNFRLGQPESPPRLGLDYSIELRVGDQELGPCRMQDTPVVYHMQLQVQLDTVGP